MGDAITNLTPAEFKVAYAVIIKKWSVDKMGPLPSLALFNQAASLGHAHQTNNTVVGAMHLRKGGFTRAQMLAYCLPCMNSINADIAAGLTKPVVLPKVGGKNVYAATFVKAKVKVSKAVATKRIATKAKRKAVKAVGKAKVKVKAALVAKAEAKAEAKAAKAAKVTA